MEDNKIIELYWSRSELAVSRTAEKYGGYCFAIAENILHSREDSDECVNDTWLNAWSSMPPQRPNILSAFLARITRNLAFNRYNYLRRQKRGGGLDILLSELEECIASPHTVERGYDEKRTAEVIGAFLKEIPASHRALFVQRYFFCRSFEELGRLTGWSKGKINSLLYRMRIQLRERLEREGIGL